MAVRILGTGIILLALTLLATSTATAQQDLLSLVQAYQQAKNNQDVEALAAMFAGDAEFELVGMGTMVGSEQIRALDEYDVGINTWLEFSNCTEEGNTVTCDVVETNDWLDAAGLSENRYTSSVFTFEDGLITNISATLSPESAQALGQVLQAFTPWIAQNHPEAMPTLFTSENQFIYSRENGVLVVSLLREWRASSPAALPTTGGPSRTTTAALWLVAGGLLFLLSGAALYRTFSRVR